PRKVLRLTPAHAARPVLVNTCRRRLTVSTTCETPTAAFTSGGWQPQDTALPWPSKLFTTPGATSGPAVGVPAVLVLGPPRTDFAAGPPGREPEVGMDGSARVPRRCAAAAGPDGTGAALSATAARLARLTVRALATPQPA